MEKTMNDITEDSRKEMVEEINSTPGSREALEQKYGKVWNTKELQQDFDVKSFMAPFVVVERKSDRAIGSLKFQHSPRFYYEFEETSRTQENK